MPASSASRRKPSRRCSSASASTHAADRRVGTYSKGMRQRLGLAQALLGEPRVLLLDEPTTGLDPALRRSFYEIVEELRGRGATVLLSSHALTELEERAGRVVIMNRGVKVADGTLDELRRIARLPTRIRLKVTRCRAGQRAELARAGRRLAPGQRPHGRDRRHARAQDRGAAARRPTKARRSRISTSCRRPSTSSTPTSCVRRRPRDEKHPDRRAQGDPGGPAQPLGAGDDAAAGGAGPHAHLPRQRADRHRRRARRSTW